MKKIFPSGPGGRTEELNGTHLSDGCIIEQFPKPYKLASTPFQENDFDPKTIAACEQNKDFQTGVRIAKVIVVGDVAVGKTCLVNRFCHEKFDFKYKGTIGVDFEVKKFQILKTQFNLQLWDTAGQERFRSIASSYYRGAHAIVLVFDMKRDYSLQAVPHWLGETLQHSTDPLLFLVGTKMDLVSPANFALVEKDATIMAMQMKAEFWPVSAKTGENVQEFFNRVAALTFCKTVLQEIDGRPENRISSNFIKVAQQGEKHKGCKLLCSK